MDDVQARLSEFDRALADALDVDVSPDFVARVSRRIALEPPPAPVWQGWRIALPIAAAVAMVIAAAVLTRTSDVPSPLLNARTLHLPPWGLAEPRVTPPTAPTIAAKRPAPRVAATASTIEPEVLVPREEIEVYRRLIAAAQAVRGPAIVDGWKTAPEELTISAIQIDPIRIDFIAPPASGEGDRR